jgi:ferredoxin
MSRILKKKYTGNSFFGRIPAVENYAAIFGSPTAQTVEKRTAMQREATEIAARCIVERRANRVNTFRPFSSLVSLLFAIGVKIFYRYFRVSEDCNGCGICEKICPVSAIAIQDGHPVFSKKCEHCQGCLSLCPQRAIHFGRIGPDTPCYHHPEISINDLFR